MKIIFGIVIGMLLAVVLQPLTQADAIIDIGTNSIIFCDGKGFVLSVKPRYQPRITIECKEPVEVAVIRIQDGANAIVKHVEVIGK